MIFTGLFMYLVKKKIGAKLKTMVYSKRNNAKIFFSFFASERNGKNAKNCYKPYAGHRVLPKWHEKELKFSLFTFYRLGLVLRRDPKGKIKTKYRSESPEENVKIN